MYNSRSKFNICKTAAKRKWGHWMSINFVSNDWNDLNQDTVHQKLGILQSLRSLYKSEGGLKLIVSYI